MTNPFIPLDEIESNYDYEQYFNRKEKIEHAERKSILDKHYLKHLPDTKTLVLGCGIFVEKQIPSRKKIYYSDISKKNIEYLNNKGYSTMLFDVRNKWPTKDKEFNQIIAIDLIEHLGQIENFVNEINRTLSDNGIIFVSTPLLNYWKNYLKLLKGTTIGVQYDEHPRLFFDKDIKKIFTNKGFSLTKVEYLGLKGYGYYTFKKEKNI